MRLFTAIPIVGASALLTYLPVARSQNKPPKLPKGGCETPAAVTFVVGSGLKPEAGVKVIDNNLRSKWVAKGKGKSLRLELAAPTIIDSVSIAFRKGKKRVHTFAIYLATEDNQAELVYEGESSGTTKHFQTFSLGNKAKEAEAVTIMGFGNSKNKWNGYAEVQLCTHETPEEATPELEVVIETPETETGTEAESGGMPQILGSGLPFPVGRKGFNVVNQCSFPIRVGSTGNQAPCNDGSKQNPANGLCFWALPEGQRDLRPGEFGHYVLPRLDLEEGQITWAGNIWASTGCTSSASEDFHFPSTTKCVTNFCNDGGACPDYRGPSGVTTKAEFALVEGGFDFYDVSIIDGSNIPMEIVPIDPLFNPDDHFCATPGHTATVGALQGCKWKFDPENIDGQVGTNFAPYTRVVWPADPDSPRSCLGDTDCADEAEGFRSCGIYEERDNNGDTKTGSAIPGTCGKSVGWMGAHTACSTKARGNFPGEYPFMCNHAASDGTVKQLIRCAGPTYSKQACYLPDAEESCCGCPPWDIENGGCISSNPEWTQIALPWTNFFKSACPTAYSFPRDDRTSMFVCSNSETETRPNTQSYLIRFCPGDSEQSFYG